jgi:hypothetical protein
MKRMSIIFRVLNPRCGFLLPVVLVMLMILFLLAMTRNYFSRQRLNMADHLRDYELSYQMAASGMLVGTRLFDQAVEFLNDARPETFPTREKAPAAIKPIIQGFLDDQGLPFPQGASLIIDNHFVNAYAGEDREARGVQLTMEMRRKKPLFDTSADPGFQIDDREILYEFFLHAEGRYGASSARVTTFFEGRFVNILPPVLGKFALFLREQPPGGMNLLGDSESAALVKNAPLVIKSPETAGPNSLLPAQVAPLLDRQGWVYLGGLTPWRLNVSQGGGNPDLGEAFLRPGLFLFPFPAASELGKIPGLSLCVAQWRLGRELTEDTKKKVMVLKQPVSETVQTSLLHVFGSVKHPSPTLVFGTASRRWMLMQGIKSEADPRPACFPFLDQNTFSSSSWPGDGGKTSVSRTIQKHFNHSYEEYSRGMSDIFEEDANASNLYALKIDDTEASSSPILSADMLPAAFAGVKNSRRMQVNNAPALFFKMNSGSTFELKNTDGKVLFSGGDLQQIQSMNFMENKAGIVFENEKEFWKKMPKNAAREMHIGGVVLVKGNLTVADPLVISAGGGGIILCTGNVRIKSSISCQSNQPLAIYALSQNIWVETTRPVDAALLALNGRIHLPPEGVINGLVAARSLDLPVGIPEKKREINYQTRFDPTDAENYRKAYRMMVAEKRYSFVH